MNQSSAERRTSPARAADSTESAARERVIRLAGFDQDGIADGPGLRCVVFVQGCPHHCPGCQNPQTWAWEGGAETTPSELRDRIFSTVLDTGVTFSGGEPFEQADALADLAQMLRPRYDVASYSGYTFEGLLKLSEKRPGVMRLLRSIDILVDGPFVQARADRLLLFRGSGNQRILDVPASLAAGSAVWTKDPAWVGEDGSARVAGAAFE